MSHKKSWEQRKKEFEAKIAVKERAEKLLLDHNIKTRKMVVVKKKIYLDLLPHIKGRYDESVFLRNPSEWEALSFNIEKQIISFLKWVYCEYKVPRFMFNIFLREEENNPYGVFGIAKNRSDDKLFNWFIAIAQGKSFYKIASDILTRREAHIFLEDKNDLPVYLQIWRAKCITTGASKKFIHVVSNCLYEKRCPPNNLWLHMPAFLSKFEEEINRNDLMDVIDYLKSSSRDENFLKGRTFSSLIKATNKWHDELQTKRSVGELDLKISPIKSWEWLDKYEHTIWYIRQITNGRDLINEGRRMHHCVASYSQLCVTGTVFIFTMSTVDDRMLSYEDKRLTIEVSHMKIIQARGKCNAQATKKELNVLRKWATQNRIEML